MNKIEEMIKELCPNGVEWKKLGEVCKVLRGKRLTKSQLTESGKYKVYHGGIEPIGFYGEMNRNANTVMVINVGASAGSVSFSKEDFWSSDGCYCISQTEYINSRFLYYYFLSIEYVITTKVRHAGIPTLDSKVIEDLLIPLPTLPIQTEIVRILDKFVEQQEQLERLIELRKKQYEYYREEMLKNVNGERGKLIDLLIQPITDGPHVTPKFVDEGVPFISATAIYDGKIHLKDAQGFVTKDFDKECSKKYKPKKFDVYMVKSGSTTGKVALVDFDDDFNVWSPLAAMRTQNEIQAKYLYHLLQTSNIQNQVLLGMSQGSQPNLSMRTLEQFNVIIPNNEEQERIVNVLDKIESNVFIMKSALEASKKRYEYYRDEMMRF